MRNIIDKMNSLYPISDETIQILKENTVLCHFPKRHQLIEANKFCKSAYFIEEGMTHSFWLVNGEEITTSFACEGAIVFSMDELYYNKMSEEFVETLEDVVAYRISLTDLLRLFQTNIELANWGRVIHQNEYRRLHRSHKDRLTLSAKERYEAFKLQFPQMCQRIQLGLSPLIWASHYQHSAASEHTNNSHTRQDFDAGQIFKLINSVFLRLLQ